MVILYSTNATEKISDIPYKITNEKAYHGLESLSLVFMIIVFVFWCNFILVNEYFS